MKQLKDLAQKGKIVVWSYNYHGDRKKKTPQKQPQRTPIKPGGGGGGRGVISSTLRWKVCNCLPNWNCAESEQITAANVYVVGNNLHSSTFLFFFSFFFLLEFNLKWASRFEIGEEMIASFLFEVGAIIKGTATPPSAIIIIIIILKGSDVSSGPLKGSNSLVLFWKLVLTKFLFEDELHGENE